MIVSLHQETTGFIQNLPLACPISKVFEKHPTKSLEKSSIVQRPFILTDHQTLLKSCMAGDRTSQAALYTMYAPKMLGTCLWYAKNKEEAEEILQDGFIRVFRFIHQFSGKGSFEGWIRKIMVNAALQKHRKNNPLMIVSPLERSIIEIPEFPDILEKLASKDLLKMVQNLPPSYRIVFTLHVLEGMKHREIAQLLGISEGTSKSNLFDARNLLKKALTISKTVIIR